MTHFNMSGRLRIYLDNSQHSFTIKGSDESHHLTLPQTTITNSVIVVCCSGGPISYRILNPTTHVFSCGDEIKIWLNHRISDYESPLEAIYIEKGKYYHNGELVITDDPISGNSDKPIISPILSFKSVVDVHVNYMLSGVKWEPYYIGHINSSGSKINIALHGLIVKLI